MTITCVDDRSASSSRCLDAAAMGAGSSSQHLLLSHQPSGLLTPIHLPEHICAPVPHRQVVVTMPKWSRLSYRSLRSLLHVRAGRLPSVGSESIVTCHAGCPDLRGRRYSRSIAPCWTGTTLCPAPSLTERSSRSGRGVSSTIAPWSTKFARNGLFRSAHRGRRRSRPRCAEGRDDRVH